MFHCIEHEGQANVMNKQFKYIKFLESANMWCADSNVFILVEQLKKTWIEEFEEFANMFEFLKQKLPVENLSEDNVRKFKRYILLFGNALYLNSELVQSNLCMTCLRSHITHV